MLEQRRASVESALGQGSGLLDLEQRVMVVDASATARRWIGLGLRTAFHGLSPGQM